MTSIIQEIVDLERFPIGDPGGEQFRTMLGDITSSLEKDGCAVLQDFIRPEFRATMAREVSDVAHLSYDRLEQVNVYNTDIEQVYPADHPASIVMERGNAFVARDLIGENAVIAQLYLDQDFKNFIATCFGLGEVHELADPYAGLCANILRPGLEHPWHLDTNEFTVSMLTQSSSDGGTFEYCPNIRSPGSENMADVLDVVATSAGNHVSSSAGNHVSSSAANRASPSEKERASQSSENRDKIKQLALRPGDLQLFKGRYSLHRVSPVAGTLDRHSVIFAYSELPGVIGAVERTRQLFGRVSQMHMDAEKRAVRNDCLMD